MKCRGRYVTILMIAAVLLLCGNFSNYANAGFRFDDTNRNERWRDDSGSTSDIQGEVGYPLTVRAPIGVCNGVWGRGYTASYRIVSGQLPPGLHFQCDNGQWSGGLCPSIIGIPTERGHWIVNIELYDVQCGGHFYEGFVQELRFHISGSGKVVQ
jgi:hypothetical protein